MTTHEITRDGVIVSPILADADAAFAWLLRHVPYSVSHATRHEGYAIRPAAAERWDTATALEQGRTARRLLRDHGHDMSDTDRLTLENCGACTLAGYGADATGPNYAGWERIYVQARRPIPRKWRAAFEREQVSEENTRYRDALRRDVVTYGVAHENGED